VSCFLLKYPCALLAALEFVLAANAQPYPIGGRKQLFIDRRFVTESRGVELAMNPPVKVGPVLIGTQSWDNGFVAGYGSVLQDQGKYRMWYIGMPSSDTGQPDYAVCRLCYAESDDALHWTKPDLGICDWRGSRANNIVLETSLESACVLIDPKAAAAERYKLVAHLHERTGRTPNGNAPAGTGLYIYTSPDGLRWTLHSERVFPFDPDSLNMAFYDGRTGKYFAYVRTWNPLRRVGVVETDDLLKPWPYRPGPPRGPVVGVGPDHAPSQEVDDAFGTDAEDPPNMDFYTSAVVAYPWAEDAYLMFPSAYRHFPAPPAGQRRNDGTVDIDLAVSRDAHTFHRISREPYIGLGTMDEPDNGTLYLFIGMLRRDNVLYQYYEGNDHTHGVSELKKNRGTIFAVRQRLDGFSSIDAGPSGGQFATPPVIFAGRHLVLNLDASATGEISVELQDAAGKPLSGFTFADSDPLIRNNVAETAAWKGGDSDLSRLAGTPVRVAFRMRLAKLYSFQFSE